MYQCCSDVSRNRCSSQIQCRTDRCRMWLSRFFLFFFFYCNAFLHVVSSRNPFLFFAAAGGPLRVTDRERSGVQGALQDGEGVPPGQAWDRCPRGSKVSPCEQPKQKARGCRCTIMSSIGRRGDVFVCVHFGKMKKKCYCFIELSSKAAAVLEFAAW